MQCIYIRYEKLKRKINIFDSVGKFSLSKITSPASAIPFEPAFDDADEQSYSSIEKMTPFSFLNTCVVWSTTYFIHETLINTDDSIPYILKRYITWTRVSTLNTDIYVYISSMGMFDFHISNEPNPCIYARTCVEDRYWVLEYFRENKESK